MFIEAFISYLGSERNYSQHTLKAYAVDLRMFWDYVQSIDAGLTYSDVDADIVRQWMVQMMEDGNAPATVNRKLSTLRAYYSYLYAEGIVQQNPVSSLKGPKQPQRLPAFLKETEIDNLIDSVDFGEGFAALCKKTIILTFCWTGLRLSELRGLDVANVDLGACRLKVFGKRSRERLLPFTDELQSQLREYIDARRKIALIDKNALFVTEKGTRVSISYIYRLVTRYVGEVSTLSKRSPHVLRHTYATALLNNGAEIGAVKELLGHRRLATTEVYTHLTFEDLKKSYNKAHPRAGNN